MLRIVFVSLLLSLTVSFGLVKENDYPAYLIYDKNGKEVSFSKMVKAAYESDIVFAGELHNNPISHWIELQLAKSLYLNKNKSVVMGAEMFEADNQLILDEYLNGTISSSNFMKEMRLWPNYETDYKPLVEFAKNKSIPMIATNVPRRYASMVFKKGFEGLDSLSGQAYNYIAPLPIDYDPSVPCYKKMLTMGGGHASPNMPKAQALKDATMAHFILKNWKEGSCFLHFNGAYHSDQYEGIVWHIKRKNDAVKVMTITTVLQDDVTELLEENEGRADFILCVASDMTPTH